MKRKFVVFREAAEHLLTALNQQAAGRGAHGERATTMSDTIWSTLKLVTALMERHDLYPAIDDRSDAVFLREIRPLI